MEVMFRHATVPIDGSKTAARGVDYALELASAGGRLTFCSVVDPALAMLPGGTDSGAGSASMLRVLDGDAALVCAEAANRAARRGIAAETHVLHGALVDRVDALVRRTASDVVIVGTHGRTGIARVFLGSVAAGLIRKCAVPVIAVHTNDASPSGPIEVAVDSSPAARAALDVALHLSRVRRTPLLLVHVCEATRAGLQPASALLDDALRYVRSRGAEATCAMPHGNPARELLRIADERESCMIVMGTHGRKLPSRLVVGSIAESTVAHARVPVLTVRDGSASAGAGLSQSFAARA
jgi:nucleotide-binding universal stress UspA family protein